MSRAKKAKHDAILNFRPLGVSDSAIAAVISHVKANPDILALSDTRGRRDVSEAILQQFEDTSWNLTLPLQDGSDFVWPVLASDKMLNLFATRSPAYKRLLEKSLSNSNDNTLNLILYHDEITPGNVLRTDNPRKCSAFYVGFLEFRLSLRSEFAWLTIAVLRSSIAHQVKGGMSCVVRTLLRSLLVGERSLPTGCIVRLSDPRLLFGRMGMLLADNDALKGSLDNKGASGLRPCFGCRNCVSKCSDFNDRYLVDITEANFNRFEACTDLDIWTVIDHLAAQSSVLNKGRFETLQKAAGFNHNSLGWLSDLQLREYAPPSCAIFDCMHAFFSHGGASTELHLFMTACKRELGIKYEHFEAFFQPWVAPKHVSALSVKQTFCKSREAASADGFKGTASDVLAMFPLMRQFCEMVVAPTTKLVLEVASFRCMADVVEKLQLAKKMEYVPDAVVDVIMLLLSQHLHLFCQAYGVDEVKPKHHYAFHAVSQIKKFSFYTDCFVLERKHRQVKRHANLIQNSGSFEKSLLSRVLAEQLTLMPATFDGVALEGPCIYIYIFIYL